MSYRLEKEENGERSIVISGWEKGIGNSAENGIQLNSNVSLELEGEIASGWSNVDQTIASGTLGKLLFGCVDYSVPAGTGNGTYTYYMLDTSGQAWGSAGDGTWHPLGNTTTGADGTNQGIVVWHNYIFIMRGANIDYAATNNPTSWSAGWKTDLTAGRNHSAIVAQTNDVIYICNGNQIASLAWNGGSTFDPTSSGTYTYNTAALLLPFDEEAVSLEILGTNLMVGGLSNRIYPWDRTSTTYNAPILLPETYVWRMVNANNFLYIFMGNSLSRGRIYVTSGSAVSEFFKMPDSIANSVEPYWNWGGAMWHRNHLVFSAIPYKNSGNTAIAGVAQVWGLKLGVSILGSVEQRLFSIHGLLSTQVANVLLPVIGNTAKGGWDMFMGLFDTSNSAFYSIAASSSTSGLSGVYSVYSEIIPVGTLLKPKTFAQVEFKLSMPLSASESVKIYYRSNLNDSFTQMGSTFSTTGIISGYTKFNIKNLQWIQLQIIGTGLNQSSHVRLTEVRIR